MNQGRHEARLGEAIRIRGRPVTARARGWATSAGPRWRRALPLVTALLVLAGCGGGEAPAVVPAAPADPVPKADATVPAYVGMAVCAECHAEATADWTGSHHHLAMARADDSTVRGDFDAAVFRHGGIESRFFRRDGRFLVHTDGADGEMAEFELQWTFGWEPLQQYLIEFPDGRLQALGIAWDTRPPAAGGQRWFHVYGDEPIPATDELHWTMPAQNWNYMCADCHSTGYVKHYDPASDTFASTWSDINVACEACHGPGSVHVARAGAGTLAGGHGFPLSFALPDRQRILHEGATTLTMVGGGDNAAMQVEACGRCHARRAPIAAEYRHGTPLLDSYLPANLTDALYFPDGQILDEVFEYGSFRQSRMYAAGVVCIDCHQPHSLKLHGDGDGVCVQCHLPAHYQTERHARHAPGPGAPGCVDCHMPARNYMVVDSRRDHSFRVPRPDLAVELGVPNACATCHADRPADWSARAVRDWLGRDAQGLQDFAHTFAAGRAGTLDAGDPLREIVADPGQPAIVRATALELLRGYPGSATVARAAAALEDADPAVRLAALAVMADAPLADRLAVVKPLWTDPVRAVRIEAARLSAGVNPQALRATERQQLSAALDDYVDAQQASLDRPGAWLNLGNLAAATGEPLSAEQHYRAALARDQRFEPAWANLADLLFRTGNDPAANEVLAAGLRALPDGATLFHARGLYQVRAGEREAALRSLARAAELAPGNVRFQYVYAIGLDSAGRREEAVAILEHAHQHWAADQDVLSALLSMNLAAGNRDLARTYARRLQHLRPTDGQLAGLLTQLNDD